MTKEEIKMIVDELSATMVDRNKAIDELLSRFADKGDLANIKDMVGAVKQLEERFDEITADVTKKIEQVRRLSWDERGNYRGVFASEAEARQFGLFVMSKASNFSQDSDCVAMATKAKESLKSNYPDFYKLAFDPKTKAAMDSATDGALIVPEFSSRLVRLVEQFGVFESEALIMPMNSESLTFLRRTGGASVFLVGENAAPTDSKPTHGNVVLSAKEWGCLTYVPRTLDEDSAPLIGEIVAFEFAQVMSEKTDDIGFNGDGTAAYFGYIGVRKRLELINGVDDGGGLVLGSGNAYSELVQADHDKLMGVCPEYAANNAKWFCSRVYFFTVMVKIIHAAGGVTASEIEGRRQLMYGGSPVRITQKMPRTAANSQVCALYGDLRMAATVGRRRGVTIEASRDYKFAERQITYLGTQRKAITVNDVGTATEAGPIVGLITAAA